MNVLDKDRHYIHGDQSIIAPSKFYCSSCDSFWLEDHFLNSKDTCCNHWGKYDSAIKMLGDSPDKHHKFGRPMNAINVFTR